ncbi:MAG: sulfotransferase [Thermoguttaceae bacterium]|jgi:hypothetical protein
MPSVDDAAGRKAAAPTGGYKDHFWIPRFWDGMAGSAWFPLLLRNRFRVDPRRIGMAVLISCLTPLNAVLWLLQTIFFGRKIAHTRIAADPIFVIGHWRSGTTLLHELLVLDPRFTYPNTYDCFAPNHFLASGWFLRPALSMLLPKQRPMDNMAAGWDCPQEDEFALCNMGIPTPYLTIAFSNRPPQYQEYFDLERVSPEQLARWKRGLLWFLTCLTLRTPKQIVLKSPPHTFRIKVLLEMFPRARFIHIVRNPYVIFPSTVNLWKRLYRNEGFQVPNFEGLEERVFQTFERMYEVFERQKHLIPPGQFCEVRYEDLVADPAGQMRAIYDRLGLGEFEAVRPAIEAYFVQKADYQTNRYQLSPELRAEVARRWAPYLRRYGYAEEGSRC